MILDYYNHFLREKLMAWAYTLICYLDLFPKIFSNSKETDYIGMGIIYFKLTNLTKTVSVIDKEIHALKGLDNPIEFYKIVLSIKTLNTQLIFLICYWTLLELLRKMIY